MNQETQLETWPVRGPNDPLLDLDREEAAYAREQERLVRDHLGKIALIYGDEVVGVFDTADAAILEAARSLGTLRVVVKEIRASNEPDFMSLVDITHPCVRILKLHPRIRILAEDA